MCEHKLWKAGAKRLCGQRVGLVTWIDAEGEKRSACHWHEPEVRYRYPTIEEAERRAERRADLWADVLARV